MNLENKNIIVTAGGTGGHIYPALAVAELLRKNKANVTWVGTPNSMEANIVPSYFNIQYIKSSGVRKKGFIKKITFPIKLIFNILKARKILKKIKADLIIGFGGYASGPICLAGVITNTPIIIHEQNAKIGLTNRILAKFATKICLAFEIQDIHKYFNKNQLTRTKVVGNPVRTEIVALNNNNKNYSDISKLNILVLGGSQGAKAINEIMPKLIKKAIEKGLNIELWHQTGKLSFQSTTDAYKDIPQQYIKSITPFIDNVVEAYRWADLVICRAGALTVSETAIAGVPAIFIPLPSAVDDHQFYNAQNIVKNNAGFCLRQNQMNVENLLVIIESLYKDRAKLQKMSENVKNILIKNSSEQILECVKEILLTNGDKK
ncbi:MAG: undecaprenyldiphospho-muramoylpentapeptide beta-N-acetylglucosaminyltransferase [Francisella sp.]